jgi:serine/threonine protein kinase
MTIDLVRERKVGANTGGIALGEDVPTQLSMERPGVSLVSDPTQATELLDQRVAPPTSFNERTAMAPPSSVLPKTGASTIASTQGLRRFARIAELGRGAMGVVYKARDQVLERDVAVKLVGDDVKQNPEALQMFLQEAKALASLNHPNIVTVFDQGQDGPETFIVMEFIEGKTLDSMLRQSGKVTVAQTLEIADQVCAGLAYAHGRRILHRDIKPANIFVSKDGVVKIGDFGLARAINQVRLAQTKVCGTPLYMSPEQIRGTDVDFRADLYATGCMLFELLTGQPPFTTGEVMFHHMYTAPPKPSSVQPTIPPEIDGLILALLEKDQNQRTASAEALRAQVKPLMRKFH